ncbi:MAG: PP2C family serine/threonine-protein phosphatase [Gammaproteobacteria bacterium]
MFRRLIYKSAHPSLRRSLFRFPLHSSKVNSIAPILKPCKRNSSFSLIKSLIYKNSRIKSYQFKPDDYVRLAHQKIGFCEIQGNREAQEDVLDAIDDLAGIKSMPAKDIKAIYKKTIFNMQEKHGNESDQGSTLCSVVAWIDSERTLNSYTAYVGDSSSYLIVLNEKNEVVSYTRLNKKLHNPDEGRLILTDPLGFPVYSIRYDMVVLARGALALNRSIGDTAYEVVGLSHEPEIDEFKISIAPMHKAYVVVACDGLTEGNLNLNDIGEIVAKNSSSSSEIIARELVMAAYDRGSNDNISVSVMLIDSEQPISAMVCDGHGGKKVSQAVGKAFYPELKSQIRYYELQKETKGYSSAPQESKSYAKSRSGIT